MKRRHFPAACGSLLATRVALAQQAGRVYRIGPVWLRFRRTSSRAPSG